MACPGQVRHQVPGGTDLAAWHAPELAQLGPYFAVSTHTPGRPLPASWRPLSTLLAGTWTSTAPGFRRRSCCLIYRAAPAATAVCGDCILNTTSPPQRR